MAVPVVLQSAMMMRVCVCVCVSFFDFVENKRNQGESVLSNYRPLSVDLSTRCDVVICDGCPKCKTRGTHLACLLVGLIDTVPPFRFTTMHHAFDDVPSAIHE